MRCVVCLDCDLGKEHVAVLTDVISSVSSLTQLDLSGLCYRQISVPNFSNIQTYLGNKLEGYGCLRMVYAILRHPSLQTIDLRGMVS